MLCGRGCLPARGCLSESRITRINADFWASAFSGSSYCGFAMDTHFEETPKQKPPLGFAFEKKASFL